MAPMTRRFALLAAAVLTTALAACTNPVAPSNATSAPSRPNQGVYMGAGG